MDLSRYPLEKVFYFVAGIIPGFVALLVYDVRNPGSFAWFFALGFLGYKVKLALILLASFTLGNTLTVFLQAFVGGLREGWEGYTASTKPYKSPDTYEVAPWREPTWRIALRHRLRELGAAAPNDTMLMPKPLYESRRAWAESLPEPNRTSTLSALNLERLNFEIDDGNWARWYEHYHNVVLEPDQKDFLWYLHHGLAFNLETAGVYVLISSLFVPGLRHWWCIAPAAGWAILFIAQQYTLGLQYGNRWSTLTAQIRYLSGNAR